MRAGGLFGTGHSNTILVICGHSQTAGRQNFQTIKYPKYLHLMESGYSSSREACHISLLRRVKYYRYITVPVTLLGGFYELYRKGLTCNRQIKQSTEKYHFLSKSNETCTLSTCKLLVNNMNSTNITGGSTRGELGPTLWDVREAIGKDLSVEDIHLATLPGNQQSLHKDTANVYYSLKTPQTGPISQPNPLTASSDSAGHNPAAAAPSPKDEDEEASLAPRYHLSFAGCGFLGIYHLGATRVLMDQGIQLVGKVDKFSGASAGALVAAALAVTSASPHILQECEKFCWDLAQKMRRKTLGVLTPGVSLLEPVEEFLRKLIPRDAYREADGRLYVSVTSRTRKENELVSQFRDNEDLIQCLVASCCIPGLTAPKSATFRNERYIDGGLTDNLPLLEGGRTILVSPFSGTQDICPRDKPGFRWFVEVNGQDFKVNRLNLLRGVHAFFPPSPRILDDYYRRGQVDAVRFLREEGILTRHHNTPRPRSLLSTGPGSPV